jgi:putative methyltransferase
LTRATVLISEPQAHKNIAYLPYMWSVLKSHADRVEHLGGRVEWLDPIHEKDTADALLRPYHHAVPDVLGLSCYMWNWDVQCQIARQVKAAHPDCLVVAGGPHPDYKDPDFFRKHPYFDVVAVKDGEITFSRLLSKVLDGDRDFRDIGGLYLPSPTGGDHVHTGPAEVPTTFEHSPYLDQDRFYQDLIARHEPGHFNAIWETNRGCPYSCSFCDWGSNTMSKLRRFDMQRVRADIDWFAKSLLNYLILADANFGILPRDVEIADLINEARAREGYPRYVHYSPAKNNPDRVIQISQRFAATGISPVHVFSVQHTNEHVLACLDRSNISVAKQREVATAAAEHGIPTLVQLILGIPGDTYDTWKSCLTDLMEWGLHDNYQIFSYSLLPNAPAGDRSYRDGWKIQTITRDIPQEGEGQRRKDDTDALVRTDLIVESTTYSRDDWVRMKVYASFVRALHNRGFTRSVALYLHHTHGIAFRTFYDAVVEEFFGAGDLSMTLTDHFSRFLAVDGSLVELELEEFPDYPAYFEASQWLFLKLCLSFDRVFDGLTTFLLRRFPGVANLGSALDYQRHLVFLPSYRPQIGRTFPTDRDWVGYFDQAAFIAPLGEPEPAPGAVVEVRDTMPHFQSAVTSGTDPWLAWIRQNREVQRTMSVNFKDLSLRTTVQLSRAPAPR